MGFQVFLSGAALNDLEAVVAYIAPHNAPAAERFGTGLLEEALLLETFPERGRIVPELSKPGLREIPFGPYRIVYRIQHASRVVEILRFWHAARGKPELDPEGPL